MIPELTLGTATAGVIGAVGATTLINGLRHAFVDESAGGALLMALAWGILEMGALL
jgi:hypothetical protein